MKIRAFGSGRKEIVLLVGRCLEVVANDGHCVIAKTKEFGDIYFPMGDPRVAFCSESEYNDYKDHK